MVHLDKGAGPIPGFEDLTEGQRIYGLMAVVAPAFVAASATQSLAIGAVAVGVGAVFGIIATVVGGFLCRSDHRIATGAFDRFGFGRCFMRTFYVAPPMAASLVAWHLVEFGLPFWGCAANNARLY
jgi:hypothetical protein